MPTSLKNKGVPMFIDLSLPDKSFLLQRDLDMSDRNQAVMRQGHYGTHLDRYLGTAIPLEYTVSRGILFDISAHSRDGAVTADTLPINLLQEGDFVLFRCGALLRHAYASPEYFAERIEIAWDLIDALCSLGVRFIGIDSHGLRMGKEHGEVDKRCEASGVYVIENIANTEILPPEKAFTAYTSWYDLGGSGLPCRVIAEAAA